MTIARRLHNVSNIVPRLLCQFCASVLLLAVFERTFLFLSVDNVEIFVNFWISTALYLCATSVPTAVLHVVP